MKRMFILINEKVLADIPVNGFLEWSRGVVFFKAPDPKKAWEKIKTSTSVWFKGHDPWEVSFDNRRKRVVISLPTKGEFVLIMREVK